MLIYRKYYGRAFALRITALMFVTIVLAAVLIDVLFAGAGLIPSARPTRAEVFGEVGLGYKLIANVLALAVFAALFALTRRRGARDPVCGMEVDRAKALQLADGGHVRERHYFCSERCLRTFQDTSRSSIEVHTGRKPSRV